jgi:hypothetical protein
LPNLIVTSSNLILQDFNMSATMAGLGGQVQPGECDMRMVLNTEKIAIGEILIAVIAEAQFLFQKPGCKV